MACLLLSWCDSFSELSFDDRDCEMLYGQRRMQFACYCHDGIVEIKLLWPMRQVWLAYYCHGVILSASCLFDDRDCEMLYSQ